MYIENLTSRAESGDSLAIIALAICYEEGRYTSIDYPKALRLYSRAAALGDTQSQLSAASLERQKGNYGKMLHWLGKAARSGNAAAAFRLAQAFELGLGCPRNLKEAEKYYKQAARPGHMEAQFRLGLLYHNQLCRSTDEGASVRLFRKASEQGHIMAQCFLGQYYELGRIVRQDYSKAYEYYKRSAIGGFAGAQFCLGQLIQCGLGTCKSEENGAIWIRRSAEQGFPAALYLMSLLCLEGIGVEKSVIEACQWMLIAESLNAADKEFSNYNLCLAQSQSTSDNKFRLSYELGNRLYLEANDSDWAQGKDRAADWLTRFREGNIEIEEDFHC